MSGDESDDVIVDKIAINDPALKEVYDRVHNIIKTKQVSALDIMAIAQKAMMVVGQMKDLAGYEKKDLVISVVQRIVVDIPKSDEDNEIVAAAMRMLPSIIDLVIDSAKGKFDIFKTPGAPVSSNFVLPGEVYEDMYEQVKKFIKDRHFTADSIMRLAVTVMSVVEQWHKSDMTGADKKELVLTLVQKLVLEIPMGDEDRAIVSKAMSMLPAVIDLIILSSKGKIDLGAIAEKIRVVRKKICFCCKAKETPEPSA